ncbi:MAG: DNA repair protein RadC [Clostridia bacterium]|nr:DNA repair protein RadC [Clostridia bacterium]
MKETEKNLNAGHRKRMRESFLKRDIDTLADHEILEILLFYAYTRKDTNKIAHRLINRFGSLQGVFSAPYEELVKVDEVGENAASLIILFNRLSNKYSKDIYNNREVITTEKLFDIVRERFRTEKDEVAFAVFCDSKKRFIAAADVARGSLDETSFKVREIVNLAMRYDANRVVIAHNHPHGVAAPSASDAKATRDIKRALDLMDIKLDDHIIVSEDECFSMKESLKFRDIFIFC